MLEDHMNPRCRVATRKNIQAIMDLVEKARNWAQENNKKQTAERCSEKELGDQIDAREVYVCEEEDVVGTFTLRVLPRESVDKYRCVPEANRIVDLASSLSLSRFVVSRQYSGMKLGYCVIDKASETVHELGKSSLLISCWAGNARLREYYLNAGLSFLCIGQRKDDDNYRITVFYRRC